MAAGRWCRSDRCDRYCCFFSPSIPFGYWSWGRWLKTAWQQPGKECLYLGTLSRISFWWVTLGVITNEEMLLPPWSSSIRGISSQHTAWRISCIQQSSRDLTQHQHGKQRYWWWWHLSGIFLSNIYFQDVSAKKINRLLSPSFLLPSPCCSRWNCAHKAHLHLFCVLWI